MKDKVLVFGGTTEGRLLAEQLGKTGIPHAVSVATEYGFELLSDSGEDSIIRGRKDADEIGALITEEGFSVVVDATHPFADAVSNEIKRACDASRTEYIRLKRDTEMGEVNPSLITFAEDMEDAAELLKKEEGNILLLTGSKDLGMLTVGIDDKTRIFARVLPDPESIRKCEQAGLKGRQIIAMQGPFSCRMNEALMLETQADLILTKESGKTGGVDEKLKAAGNLGIKAVVIKNPENMKAGGKVFTLDEVIQHFTGNSFAEKNTVQKVITLGGCGPGDHRFFTKELSEALKKSDVVFGAGSVIKVLGIREVPVIPLYKGEDILLYLSENPGYMEPLVLFSGDTGLCSGAKKAAKVFEDAGYIVKKISGISSASLFAKVLGIGIEDVKIISAHGRSCNVRGHLLHDGELIILPSDCPHAFEICSRIEDISERLILGYELGNEGEKVFSFEEEGSLLKELKGRCLIYVKRKKNCGYSPVRGLRDDELIRGDVPMTKEEIRALSMRKLALTEEAVFYDIGAGTGSVSVEAAMAFPKISVYSVEQDPKAIELLEKNKERFYLENMEIVQGMAPEAMSDLPAPTHVFIGGSKGRLAEIILSVFEKNEAARIVINAVTAETFAEATLFVKENENLCSDMIQVFISRYREAGCYHLASAINPVHIITLWKGDKSE